MNPQHHLDDATLVRYASGDLDEAFLVVTAVHLAMCDTCRHAATVADAFGGHLLANQQSSEISEHVFDSVLEKIELGGNETLQAVRPSPVADKGEVPQPLRPYLGPTYENVAWKWVAPGIQKHSLSTQTSCNSSLYMLNIASGKAVPEHGHGGLEMTLILSGAYRDELGLFGPGDVADLDEHVEHQPKVESGEPCICLVATESLTRFKGMFSRLLQPFVGV